MSDTLRSLWREPRAPGASGPARRDWVLVAVVVLFAMLETTLRDDLAWRPAPLVVGLLAVALPWRRVRPLLVVAVVTGTVAVLDLATFAGSGQPLEVNSAAYGLLLPYALLRWGSGREGSIGLAVMVAWAVAGGLVTGIVVGEFLGGMAFFLLLAALGASIRFRTNARHRELEQVKVGEREQLARELHDAVAHHVSAIVVQAQAGRILAASDPQGAANALGVIEDEASRTLAEMRAMVGVLRDGADGDLAPQRGVDDIESLARGADGLPRVDVGLSGDLDHLAPSVGATLYRLAQESVTNARRHARHATRVEVRVEGADGYVRLTVDDDGDAVPPGRGAAGYGLVGMTERAALLGGTLEAGPGVERGWTVRAVLPRRGRAG